MWHWFKRFVARLRWLLSGNEVSTVNAPKSVQPITPVAPNPVTLTPISPPTPPVSLNLSLAQTTTPPPAIEPIYRVRDSLFSYQEQRFYYNVLHNHNGFEYHIAIKVRVADIISLTNEPTDKHVHNNKIFAKHFDFVLCDKRNFAPLLVIELDDSSHSRFDMRTSDAFKDWLCESVELPLVRIPVQQAYEVEAIWKRIRDEIDGQDAALNEELLT